MHPSASAGMEQSAPGKEPVSLEPARPWRQIWSASLRQLPVAIPPLAWAVLSWQRRWIADDGLIVTRTVRAILAGYGPVFNRGERVEVNTSALWTWLLALLTWVSRLNVYTVIVWIGVLLAPLGLLLALLGTRELQRRRAPGRPLLPVGAAVVLALPPFWDFVTSGLEDSLIFCWLGLCWWLLAGLRPDSRRRAGWLAFAAGLGWLVRPDMALGTVAFLAALWYIVRPGRWRLARLAVITGAAPAAYQVFRMGYYGLLVPNTALTKEAANLHFPQGIVYLANFAGPYRLLIPLLALLALVPLTAGRALDRFDIVRCAAALGSGALMAAYVVAIGGDFMHARMLLPATFTLLLPVMVVPAPEPGGRRAVRTAAGWACVAVIGAWTAACGLNWRVAQQAWVVPANGITNERAFWAEGTHQQYPDNPAKYVRTLLGSAQYAGSLEWRISRDVRSGKPVLIYQAEPGHFAEVPLSPRYRYPVAITGYILGTWGAGTPLDGLVVDTKGLAYPLGSHITSEPDGRPGHSKSVPQVWIVAEYSDATTAPGIPAAQLTAARKALSCGALAELDQATRAPLTLHQFLWNVLHSLTFTTVRFSPDPVIAEKELCG